MPFGARWWSKTPFVRLLPFYIAGVLLGRHFNLSPGALLVLALLCIAMLVLYFLLPVKTRYRYSFTSGIIIYLMLIFCGGLLCWKQDVRNNKDRIDSNLHDSIYLVATLAEPLVEKANSFKALASIESSPDLQRWKKNAGNIIIYFKKDGAPNELNYGKKILFRKTLQSIRNSGNPGGFDYSRYCLFQGITHQVYLTSADYMTLSSGETRDFNSFIFSCREWSVKTIREFIPGEKEKGLAEALLIGYKNDLDKDLVQSYSNTGVVHVIAISGLHLGLIYWILLMITAPLKKRKGLGWLRLFIILAALWIFSIIAGAQPSVLRSAVMFTCIATGEVLSRKGSIYNTLALSAFILLCYNPFWLWDVGFQLSYAAVLSIIIFFRAIYNWFYFQNKLLDLIWKLNAVTIAAQLLTLPFSIYHFNQVPTLFLFSNLVAVPLSSIILIGEILMCVLFFIKPAATVIGLALAWLIQLMNGYIERINMVSFAVWRDLSINFIQAVLLLALTLFSCFWLMQKRRIYLWFSLCSLVVFFSIRSYSFISAKEQNKLIVYNIPKHTAIDIVSGRRSDFICDDGLLKDVALQNFNVRPSRVGMRIGKVSNHSGLNAAIYFGKKLIIVVDSTVNWSPGANRPVDILIICKNQRIAIKDLQHQFRAQQLVIDGSVPEWKTALWKKECDSLQLPCYDVKEKGAFVMNF